MTSTIATRREMVSVVTPAFNCADFLKEAIESALYQTYKNVEIVVVDDGSTDHTREVCAGFKDRVRYIYRENDGTRGNGARALAIRESQGEWVALLDHDDRWLPTKLEEQIAKIHLNPEVGIVFTGVAIIDPQGQRTGASFGRGPSGDVFHQFLAGERYWASSALVRRDAIETIRNAAPEGDFLTHTQYWNNDTDLWMRIARYYQVVCLEKTLTEYRYHPANDSANRSRLWETDLVMLEAKLPYLHENCQECVASMRAGRKEIKRQIATAYFDKFIAGSACKDHSFNYLARAIRTDFRLLLHARKCGALAKYFVRSLAMSLFPKAN
jgi:glycosyltransferase involved in cell wall biosynthesis